MSALLRLGHPANPKRLLDVWGQSRETVIATVREGQDTMTRRTPHPDHVRQGLVEKLEALQRSGVTTRRAQAEALGVPLTTLTRWIRQDGLKQKRSLKRWIPWRVAAEHHDTQEARHLRFLAQAAEQVPTKYRSHRGMAIQWAARLVAEGKDVDYRRDMGFLIITANPQEWHLRTLLDAAQRFVAGLPQLDDLGE